MFTIKKYTNGGHPVEPLKIIGDCDKDRTGTTVTFLPDASIFQETTVFDYDILRNRLRELAFLNRGLRITLYDDREVDKKESFFVTKVEYVNMLNFLNKSKQPIHNTIIDVIGQEGDIMLEVAMQYNETYSSSIYSFVNNITTQKVELMRMESEWLLQEY